MSLSAKPNDATGSKKNARILLPHKNCHNSVNFKEIWLKFHMKVDETFIKLRYFISYPLKRQIKNKNLPWNFTTIWVYWKLRKILICSRYRLRKLGREFINNKFVGAKLALVFFICHADGISLLWTELFFGNSPIIGNFQWRPIF